MALITESLNSSAIDISKAFANDVTDTAWASYLRGDRGIFTRRAVRLLDNSEARAVAEIYEETPTSAKRSTATSTTSRRCCAACCRPATATRWR
jgi:hypothetical protein